LLLLKPFTAADFQQAKEKHLTFQRYVRAVPDNQQTAYPSAVRSQYACDFGRWVYGHALIAYERFSAVYALEKAHAAFHVAACELVRLQQDGKKQEAGLGLDEMERRADQVLYWLNRLEKQVLAPDAPTTLASTAAENEPVSPPILHLSAVEPQDIGPIETEREVLYDFFMQAPAAHCILRGPAHIYEFANPAYRELIGERELIGKPVREALPELEKQGFCDLLDTVFTTGKPFIGKEVPVVLDRGAGALKHTYLNIVYQPIKDRFGKIDSILVFAYEVTDQVVARKVIEESESRYRTLSDNLEQQVQVRTRELQASIQDLERSNENLQQFAYIASHDLQEPLRKIQSFGNLLQMQYAGQLGDGVSHLVRMQSAANRMSILIRDLLMFSRISTRQQAAGPVSMNQVVQVALADLELSIHQTKAEVDVSLLPVVQGDASQLGQLMTNLISNALKFHRMGEEGSPVPPRVKICAQTVWAGDLPAGLKPSRSVDRYYRIDVIDNGIGFDEKYLDRIFQVFQRLHGHTKFAGTGIGLAICEKVATNHGGAITASSSPGLGSAFQVYLPSVNE
jgi:signal transduction histidine kinase